jgi:hypothetical protein
MEPWLELPPDAGVIETFWPLVFVAATAVALAALLVFGARLFRGTRVVREVLRCPVKHRDFVVDCEITAWDAARVDVKACAAFEPPTAITCDKACLRLGKAAAGAR